MNKNILIAFNGLDLVELYKLEENHCYYISELQQPYNKQYYDLKRNTGFIKNKLKNKVYRFFFKNKENINSFKENPDLYLPRYGGFSSFDFLKEEIENYSLDTFSYNAVLKYKKLYGDDKKSLYFFKNEENMNTFFSGAKYVRIKSPQQAYISLHSSTDIKKIFNEAKEILDTTPKNSKYYQEKEKNFKDSEELYKDVNTKSFCNLDQGEDYIKSHYKKIADQRWINLWGDLQKGPINTNLF
jgi:hypothetical protein